MRIKVKWLRKAARMGVLLDKDTNIRGYNESQASITLRVPYIFQEHVNLCTDASASMILKAWGYEPTYDMSVNPRLPFKGSSIASQLDLLDVQTAGGYIERQIFWFSEPINTAEQKMAGYWYHKLKKFGPLGVENKSHAQVLIGVDAQRNLVLLHDPWKGPNKVNTFKKFIGEMVTLTYLSAVDNRKAVPAGSLWKT